MKFITNMLGIMFKPLKRSLLLVPLFLLAGCNTIVMNPKGDIASQQADLIVLSTVLMLIIIVPVIFLTCFFAWKYRQANVQADYDPEWDHSTKLELVIWGAPLLIIIVLGLVTWVSTHKLDPYRPLDRIDASTPLPADHKPLVVEATSLDWKWLFIYPEQGIATVNELVTPVNVPVRFKITSSEVKNSFYIPALAGQIYSMAGMETQLNAVINEEGSWKGFSANYSGAGFSHMRFDFKGVSQSDFDEWVAMNKRSGKTLDRAAYLELEKPSTKHPVERFGAVEPELFHAIVNRCVVDGTVCMDTQMMADAMRNRTNLSADELSVLIEEAMCRITTESNALPIITSSKKSGYDAVSY